MGKMAQMATTSTAESIYDYTPGQTRTLHVQFDNWKWRKASILDADKKTELYRLECHLRSPQMILHPLSQDASSTGSGGEATFHYLTSRIDVHLHGQDIKLASRGLLKDGYTYASPAQNGAKMTWQSQAKWDYLNLVCLNDKAIPVARTSMSSWSMTKAGTIELTGENVMSEGPERDEVIMTGLAVLQQRFTTYYCATGG